MSYFFDKLKNNDPYLKIDNVAMPEVSEPEQVTFNLITDSARPADTVTMEGSVKGIKRELNLKWPYMNKEHFDTLWGAIVTRYRNSNNMFLTVTFNSFSPDGIVTMNVYAGSKMIEYSVADTTDRLVDSLGASYAYGGNNYDILYKDVSIHFVER